MIVRVVIVKMCSRANVRTSMNAKAPTWHAISKRKSVIILKAATNAWIYCKLITHQYRHAQMVMNSIKIQNNVTVSRLLPDTFHGPAKMRCKNVFFLLMTADINECETKLGKRTCGSNKECVNTPGGYDCVGKKSSENITTKWVEFHKFRIWCILLTRWTLFQAAFLNGFAQTQSIDVHKGVPATRRQMYRWVIPSFAIAYFGLIIR